MHLPRVLVGDVVHSGSNPSLGHHRVGLAKKRLADDQHAGAGFRRGDRPAQAGASRAHDEHIGLDCLVCGSAHETHRGSCRTPARRSRM